VIFLRGCRKVFKSGTAQDRDTEGVEGNEVFVCGGGVQLPSRLWGLRSVCQLSLGLSPSENYIWCILTLKSGCCWENLGKLRRSEHEKRLGLFLHRETYHLRKWHGFGCVCQRWLGASESSYEQWDSFVMIVLHWRFLESSLQVTVRSVSIAWRGPASDAN